MFECWLKYSKVWLSIFRTNLSYQSNVIQNKSLADINVIGLITQLKMLKCIWVFQDEMQMT